MNYTRTTANYIPQQFEVFCPPKSGCSAKRLKGNCCTERGLNAQVPSVDRVRDTTIIGELAVNDSQTAPLELPARGGAITLGPWDEGSR